MRFNDYQKAPTGLFTLNTYLDGKLVDVFEEKNLIVDGNKFVHSRLIGGNTTNNSISQFGVGTNGTTPVVGNTVLTSPFIKAIGGVSYPDTSSALFSFSLSSAEANGLSIMEFGLLTGANTLYARKVRAAPLLKASDISLTGTWLITF